MIDFTAYPNPIMAVACPDCGRPVGAWCVRPSGHKAMGFHKARGVAADAAFIAQHGPRASIEGMPGAYVIDPTGYAEELTPEGLQLVIPGCEKVAPEPKGGKAVQLSLF